MRLYVFLIILFFSVKTIAQQPDSVRVLPDSVAIALSDSLRPDARFSFRRFFREDYPKPGRAALLSLLVPGAGQAYNKRWWKLPIVYGGFYVLTYVAFRYNDLYNQYKNELYQVVRDKGYVPPSGYTESQLRSVTEFYRRQRDFFLILDGMWYLLQLVDAHVDAHLREFDLNPQLKVSLGPSMQYNPLIGSAPGFGITLTF